MTLPLLQEYFTEAEAMASVICPKTVALEQPRTCIGHTCGAWRWKKIGIDPEVEGHVGFCGVGGKP